MNVEIDEKYRLTVRVTEFLEELCDQMDEVDLMALLESLSCMDKIIKNVTDQLIDGCTDNGSWGSSGNSPESPTTPLDIAKRRIAISANAVADGEIYRLVQALKWEKKHHEEITRWAWAMFHAWPENYWQTKPRLEDYK